MKNQNKYFHGSAKYPNPPDAIAFGTDKTGLVTFAKYIAQEFGRK